MSRKDDKATASREVVEDSENNGMFDAAERLKETLELVTRGRYSVKLLDNGNNVQCKVVRKAQYVEVAASLIDSRSSLAFLSCFR